MISWYHLDSSGTRALNLVCSLTRAPGEVYLPRGFLLASQGRRTPMDARQTCTSCVRLSMRSLDACSLSPTWLDYSRDWRSWQISPFELSNVCQWFASKVFQNALRRTCLQERRIRLFSDFLPHLAFETISVYSVCGKMAVLPAGFFTAEENSDQRRSKCFAPIPFVSFRSFSR